MVRKKEVLGNGKITSNTTRKYCIQTKYQNVQNSVEGSWKERVKLFKISCWIYDRVQWSLRG